MNRKINKISVVGLITCVLIFGIILPIIVFNTLENEKPIYYIATDDIQLIGSQTTDHEIYKTGLKSGYYSKYDDRQYKFYLKFNLENKPLGWTKCEIQIYKNSVWWTEYQNPVMRVVLYLGGNWTEETIKDSGDITAEVEDTITFTNPSLYMKYNCKEKGFQKFDITKFIGNNKTITISSSFYHMHPEDIYGITIYSKEADVGIEFKPQLIWS